MEKKYVRVCPVCNSTDVQPDLSADSYAKGFFNQWKCNNCGHVSLFFPEYPKEDAAKMKEKKQ
jgi:rubredoxin